MTKLEDLINREFNLTQMLKLGARFRSTIHGSSNPYNSVRRELLEDAERYLRHARHQYKEAMRLLTQAKDTMKVRRKLRRTKSFLS